MRDADPRRARSSSAREALTPRGADAPARRDPRVRSRQVSADELLGAARAPGARTPSIVDGVELRRGSRVRLRPRAGGDVFDLALAGRTAVVEDDRAGHGGRRPARGHGRGRPGPRPRRATPARATASSSRPRRSSRSATARRGRATRILVAGIGNVFLGDDGFGVAVAGRLARQRAARRASRSSTSASAAWTSPTRCATATTPSILVDAAAARRRARARST